MRSYAIQLFFDPAGEAAFRALWDQVAEAAGTVSLSTASVPHVTLLIFLREEADMAEVRQRLEGFARKYSRFPLHFQQAGIFPGFGGVVYLAPAMTRYLLLLHRALHRLLRDLLTQGKPYYHPDRWVPHCSLTLQATQEQMLQALKLLTMQPLRIDVTATAIGLDELPPATTIARYELRSRHRRNKISEAGATLATTNNALLLVPKSGSGNVQKLPGNGAVLNGSGLVALAQTPPLMLPDAAVTLPQAPAP